MLSIRPLARPSLAGGGGRREGGGGSCALKLAERPSLLPPLAVVVPAFLNCLVLWRVVGDGSCGCWLDRSAGNRADCLGSRERDRDVGSCADAAFSRPFRRTPTTPREQFDDSSCFSRKRPTPSTHLLHTNTRPRTHLPPSRARQPSHERATSAIGAPRRGRESRCKLNRGQKNAALGSHRGLTPVRGTPSRPRWRRAAATEVRGGAVSQGGGRGAFLLVNNAPSHSARTIRPLARPSKGLGDRERGVRDAGSTFDRRLIGRRAGAEAHEGSERERGRAGKKGEEIARASRTRTCAEPRLGARGPPGGAHAY